MGDDFYDPPSPAKNGGAVQLDASGTTEPATTPSPSEEGEVEMSVSEGEDGEDEEEYEPEYDPEEHAVVTDASTTEAQNTQMSIPPPQRNYAPTHSTTSYVPPQSNYTAQNNTVGLPTTVNLGPVSRQTHEPQSEHPPGYQQNIYAQEMTPAQRSSLEEQERRESIIGGLTGGGSSSGMGGDTTATDTAGNAWNALKNWAGAAGEKLAETEEIVWKKINGH